VKLSEKMRYWELVARDDRKMRVRKMAVERGRNGGVEGGVESRRMLGRRKLNTRDAGGWAEGINHTRETPPPKVAVVNI
jgi:hypothetical protein